LMEKMGHSLEKIIAIFHRGFTDCLQSFWRPG